MLQIIFALLAGVLTVGAPCILPLLPILLGASIGQRSAKRPLAIVAGFVVMFSIAGLSLSYIVQTLMIAPDTLRTVAVIALMIFGLLLIIPGPFEKLTESLSGLIGKAQQTSQRAGEGLFGGFVLGLILGLIWTPCAGPILGSILTLIATQANIAKAAILLIAYAIGAGIPMLIIAYGGQFITTKVRALTKYTTILQRVFGVLIALFAVAMLFQYDVKLQAKILEWYSFPTLEETLLPRASSPQSSQPITEGELPDYGLAPEITGITQWHNSTPLTMQDLRGKVVLVDFWTYSCINCIRTLPHVTSWYETYKDKGFVVLGVHTPEFDFEKVPENVQTALERYNITYPVAQDNNFGTWNAYQNQYWPAHYLIDQEGHVRAYHFGEGNYDEMERNIQHLLGINQDLTKVDATSANGVGTPETYFGTQRLQLLTASQSASNKQASYAFPESLEKNHFALNGPWTFHDEYLSNGGKDSSLRMNFTASALHMVASSDVPTQIRVIVDGKFVQELYVQESKLYTLYQAQEPGEHTLELEFTRGDVQLYTFTFG